MSAFLCSDKHINALVDAAVHYARKGDLNFRRTFHAADAQALAELLYAENWRSLHARYEDRAEQHWTPGTIRHQQRPLYGHVTLLKLCDCYDYQACESDDYDQTLAAKAITELRHLVIRDLPGYEQAPWGLD